MIDFTSYEYSGHQKCIFCAHRIYIKQTNNSKDKYVAGWRPTWITAHVCDGKNIPFSGNHRQDTRIRKALWASNIYTIQQILVLLATATIPALPGMGIGMSGHLASWVRDEALRRLCIQLSLEAAEEERFIAEEFAGGDNSIISGRIKLTPPSDLN